MSKAAGAIRGLEELKKSFEMKGANATTIERAISTIKQLEAERDRLNDRLDDQNRRYSWAEN